ncbi:hypothetical protein N0V85_001660 [Neurospora sp. IMI 360204]|nr:hypothetical protein N0V85_001660 [Neurospora sp. IMI 360204]
MVQKSRLLREFSNINRDQFDSLDAYSLKASWFNHRLKELNIAPPEEVQMGFVIQVRGLREHDKRMKDIHENNTTDANRQRNENSSNNKRRRNKRRRNAQAHRQQHNGVAQRYSTRQ